MVRQAIKLSFNYNRAKKKKLTHKLTDCLIAARNVALAGNETSELGLSTSTGNSYTLQAQCVGCEIYIFFFFFFSLIQLFNPFFLVVSPTLLTN